MNLNICAIFSLTVFQSTFVLRCFVNVMPKASPTAWDAFVTKEHNLIPVVPTLQCVNHEWKGSCSGWPCLCQSWRCRCIFGQLGRHLYSGIFSVWLLSVVNWTMICVLIDIFQTAIMFYFETLLLGRNVNDKFSLKELLLVSKSWANSLISIK